MYIILYVQKKKKKEEKKEDYALCDKIIVILKVFFFLCFILCNLQQYCDSAYNKLNSHQQKEFINITKMNYIGGK